MLRTILLTFSLTAAGTALAGYVFMAPLLGALGLTAVSIDRLDTLRTSSRVVERLKQRHQRNQSRAARRLASRSGKRVASAAVAAATVGTVAVIGTVTYLEVNDYCEEKASLQEEANILYGTDTTFDFDQCLADGQADARAILGEVRDSASTAVSTALNASASFSARQWQELKEASEHAAERTGEAASALWQAMLSYLAH